VAEEHANEPNCWQNPQPPILANGKKHAGCERRWSIDERANPVEPPKRIG